MTSIEQRRDAFFELHREGTFLIANAWDIGSAKILASLGVSALATTSSGFAASLGRPDMRVSRDELVAHTAALAGAVDLPLSVDAERCFADDPDGVAETVRLLADAGAAGCSIEDYDPATDSIADVDEATARVVAAAEAANASGMLLTARAENLIHGIADLDDTIARLESYRQAAAHAVFAPGLASSDDIARVVAAMNALDAPVNVIKLPRGPSIPELADLGVRRVSVGGSLAFAAYGALVSATRELLDSGTSEFSRAAISTADRTAAFGT